MTLPWAASCQPPVMQPREARKACTRANVSNPARGDQLGNLETRQAVRDVNLERRFRVGDRRVRIRLRG